MFMGGGKGGFGSFGNFGQRGRSANNTSETKGSGKMPKNFGGFAFDDFDF